ncbi:MAG: hypothetical protein OEY14_02625, partial [Myxococcales bacterium]|nr:hypothetical protein [Myxococcales bacterium]
VVPYWLPRMLPLRAFPPLRGLRFVFEQLDPHASLINELGGISHIVPDYSALVREGSEGIRRRARERLARLPEASEGAAFLQAVDRSCHALEAWAARYAAEARRLAGACPDPARRQELEAIGATLDRVPRRGARTFREGLQSILLVQIAINLESLDNSVCPGRLDQILWPLYRADRREGRLSRLEAYELLGCFAIKLSELLPIFSERVTRFHGGLFNGQVVVVGGTTPEGGDATNDLSLLLLRLMDELRTRQPNYHARLHAESPEAYRQAIAEALAHGSGSPAVYNDARIVPLLEARGCAPEDARDYATVGCVEPVAAGKSFCSTDAALLNLPLCLELALNGGRRFGRRRREGAPTADPRSCLDMEALLALLEEQIQALVDRLLVELRAIEEANARLHPTPLSSALLEGCIEAGRDASGGGARYNGSGLQAVGVPEVGDSLAAIEHVIFRHRHATMGALVRALGRDFEGDEALRERLRAAPKYGNDDPRADAWVGRVMQLFASSFEGRRNHRGGAYVAGFYSVTAHHPFGAQVSASPSGRRAFEPFSSGLSPSAGAERRGPTAALASQSNLPLDRAPNGINFNLQLFPGPEAEIVPLVRGLIGGGFELGCMQMQLNILDPARLLEARADPGAHPDLLVRVSGYSAYFGDLSPELQDEIIERTFHRLR